MRFAVFGATGGTGVQVVSQALAAGHHVTALVRNRAGLPMTHERLRMVPGELSDQETVAGVVRGQDAVISALGPDRKGVVSVCTDGIRSILAAMCHQGVRRLLVVSAHGAAESHDRSPYVLATWAMRGNKMRDKEGMEALIRACEVDWTIVRPPMLTTGPRTGRYRTGTDLKIRLTSRISRADLAEFLLHEATNDAFVRQTPRIAA